MLWWIEPDLLDFIPVTRGTRVPASWHSALDLQAYAEALDEFVETLPIEKEMTKGQVKQLVALGQALGGAASNIRLIAVNQLLTETTEPLSSISEATQDARNVLKTIKDVSRVIAIVGDVVVLGQVIATQNWKMVLSAFKNLRSELNAASPQLT